MKSVFFTHCSDDWYEPVGCYKLEQSLKRVHPDIPFIRFGSADIADLQRVTPGIHWDVMIPAFGRMLADDYELVIHLDADSIVTAALDEALNGGYEVAGVRNNDDFGAVRYSCPGVSADSYLNCGLVAVRCRKFWEEWHRDNLAEASKFPLAEQDVFNRIAHSSRYCLKVLDPLGHHSYYGVSAHPTYWKNIELVNGHLFLRGREVRVLHQAGGHGLPKLRVANQFQNDVAGWLLRHTNSPCIRDAAGCYRGLGHDLAVEAMLNSSHRLPDVIQSVNGCRIASRLGPMDVVVDVGAHMGVFSAYISPLATRVIACEPWEDHLRVLRATVSHLRLDNVEICPFAVWTSSGETDFFVCDDNKTMHSLVRLPVQRSGASRVSCITLLQLMASYHIDQISLLKLDIEGGEFQLLMDESFSQLVTRVRHLWAKTHSIPEKGMGHREVASALGQRLSRLGYSVEALDTEILASSG